MQKTCLQNKAKSSLIKSSAPASNVLILSNNPKAKILFKDGGLDLAYDFAEKILSSSPDVFNFGGTLVLLNQDGSTTPLSVSRCLIELSRRAIWETERDSKKGKVMFPVNPPRAVAEAITTSNQWQNIRILKGVIKHPILSEDGSILNPGYGSSTSLYCHYKKEDFPQILSQPTKEDAIKAYDELLGLIKSFDLKEQYDRVAVITFMLAATCRAYLKTSPFALITAPVAGAGKGLLGRVITAFCTPQDPAAATLGSNVDECKKEIISRLLTGTQVLFFDEVALDEIDSVDLRTLATSETFGGRLLGQSRALNLPTRVLVVITANNAVPSADSARRILEIRLDPECENPSLRQFSFNPLAEIKANRSKYIAAVLTIQRAYILANPPRPDAPATGSFGDWDQWCRWPIMWLTNIDPAARMHQSIQTDPKKGIVLRIYRGWYESYGNEPKRANEISHGASPELHDALQEHFYQRGDFSVNTFGRWLGKHKDRFADGMVLRDAGLLDGNRRWRIDIVINKSGEVVKSGDVLSDVKEKAIHNSLYQCKEAPLNTTSPLDIALFINENHGQ